jgi:hypothetical protein
MKISRWSSARVTGLALFAAFAAMPAVADEAGKAVGVLLKHYGKAYGQRLVAVTGERGQDQPKQWHIFAYDLKEPSTIGHFVVSGSRVQSAKLLDAARSRQWAAPVLDWGQVRVDSGRVFRLADASARAAQVGFDSLTYQLTTDRTTLRPVWQVELTDAAGLAVGTLRVDAGDGRVLSQAWGAMAAGGRGRGPDWQIIREEMRKVGRDIGNSWQMFREDVRRGFRR